MFIVVGAAGAALQPTSKVVGRDEVGAVAAQLLVGFVVVAVDRRFLEGAVYPFDLTIVQGCLGLVRR